MCLPADGNVRMREDKSFADDLDVQRGIVSSRVALLLRSAEIQPLLSDLLLRRRSSGLQMRVVGGGDRDGVWEEQRGRVWAAPGGDGLIGVPFVWGGRGYFAWRDGGYRRGEGK